MGEPPVDGAEKDMVAVALPAVAVTPVGVPGTVAGVDETTLEGVEVPTPFWAMTSKS